MGHHSEYDPAELAAQKAEARRLDDEALSSGRLSAAQLNAKNFAFSHVDFNKARIDFTDHVPHLFPPIQDITPEEAAAGARAMVRLFDNWNLVDGDACRLLGGISKSTWDRWKNGSVAKVDRDLAIRISILLGIHKSLRYLFMDPKQGYEWINKKNQAFGGSSALEVMRKGKIFDLYSVRLYLAEFDLDDM
jgi:Protein of unknown function (DUF2384)